MKVIVHHLDWNIAESDQLAHAKITISANHEIALKAMQMNKYQHVANVDVKVEKTEHGVWEALEIAWSKTNHIESPWQENQGVHATAAAKERARSSSVGDIFQVDNDLYIVEPCGFDRIEI